MSNTDQNLHGNDKEPESDDPQMLTGVGLSGGNPVYMAESIVEEFLRMGMTPDQIHTLFESESYHTHGFMHRYGESWVREMMDRVVERMGVHRMTLTEVEPEICGKWGCGPIGDADRKGRKENAHVQGS